MSYEDSKFLEQLENLYTPSLYKYLPLIRKLPESNLDISRENLTHYFLMEEIQESEYQLLSSKRYKERRILKRLLNFNQSLQPRRRSQVREAVSF